MSIRDDYYARFSRLPAMNANGQLEFVVSFFRKADDVRMVKETFYVVRHSAENTRIVTNAEGKKLLDDDTVAPAYTRALVRSAAAANPLVVLLNYLVNQLPVGTVKDGGVTRLHDYAESVAPIRVGQQYLPDGAAWKTEQVPAVTKEELVNLAWNFFEGWLNRSQVNLLPAIGEVTDADLGGV